MFDTGAGSVTETGQIKTIKQTQIPMIHFVKHWCNYFRKRWTDSLYFSHNQINTMHVFNM
jgi:hypothetical protein